MADNQHIYGIRWSSDNRSPMPTPIPKSIANAYQATNDGAGFNVGLSIGDPVKLVSDGTIALALTTNAVYGIIVGFLPYWNGSAMVPTDYLPGGTSPGTTIRDRRSQALVVPVFPGQLWEIDCDDKVTFTTEAAYEDAEGENCTIVCPGDQSNASRPRANPLLDISLNATTAGLVARIEKISPTVANQDFSGLYVKLLISFNISQAAGQAATTIAGV
ncbi:MAG: hypothetical protein NW202_13455 [Nitrospira sp.]|nr:hypothetical protein [Nitrospira sp.]